MDFWKLGFMQRVTAPSERKPPAKFQIWKCTVYKVVFRKKESTLNHWNKSFLKQISSVSLNETIKTIVPSASLNNFLNFPIFWIFWISR